MNNDKIKILYIDDEEHNLHSFKATFRKQYDIQTTTSIEVAEDILKNHEIHVLLVDQRMPIMTGVQFFEKIRGTYPEIIRILITGHTDISAAIDAINKGEVFRFIDKPWDYKYVENAIGHGYEIFRTRHDLKQKNIELEKANEELDKFVYSASHDLRAPLMSILGIVNLALIDDELSSQNEYLELISRSVQKLDTFIVNIIDYYKNSRGLPVYSETNFDELISDVLSTIQYLPERETVTINTNIKQEHVFLSDSTKLRIIFNNLINNAIKFQDDKKDSSFVNIDIECTDEIAKIIIEDNGVGISDEDQANIFKMFYRSGAIKSGSGIGLYIVHEAVTKLNGTIKTDSKIGIGSRFEVTIASKPVDKI